MMGEGMDLLAFILAAWLSVICASLIWIGIDLIAEKSWHLGTAALVLSFVVALTVGVIINVNFLPVAQ